MKIMRDARKNAYRIVEKILRSQQAIELAVAEARAMKGEEDEAARQYAMNRLNQIIREVQAKD